MINIIAIILLFFGIAQIDLAIMVLNGSFDPLLPKERKKLPVSARKKARTLNAAAMISTSLVFIIIGIGLLFNLGVLLNVAVVMFIAITIVILFLGIKIEGKYLKDKKSH